MCHRGSQLCLVQEEDYLELRGFAWQFFYILFIANKSQMQSQTNNELILLISIVCVQSLIHLIPLCPRPPVIVQKVLKTC